MLLVVQNHVVMLYVVTTINLLNLNLYGRYNAHIVIPISRLQIMHILPVMVAREHVENCVLQ